VRAGTQTLTAIRPFQPADRDPVAILLRETGAFTADEVDVALEIMDTVIEHPDQGDYELFVATSDEGAQNGFLCIGPTPLTIGTFDLYWIAVKPSFGRQGIGRSLLEFGEERVRMRGGRLIVAETSSQPSYAGTRAFYEMNGYVAVARIRDFYTPGDDLVIYGKYFSQ
jgi:ribosomal protein S18 acetylase RimI-like enzyme